MGPNLRSVDYVDSTLNGKDSNCALLVYASTSVVMKEWDFMQQQQKKAVRTVNKWVWAIEINSAAVWEMPRVKWEVQWLHSKYDATAELA